MARLLHIKGNTFDHNRRKIMKTMYSIPVKKEFSFEKKMFREGQVLRGTFEKVGDREYFKANSLWIKLEYLDENNAQPYAVVQEKKSSPLFYALAPFAAICAFPVVLAKMLYAVAAETAESWDTSRAHV